MSERKFVYFIGDGRGHIKIGISTNPEARLLSLQTASPSRLQLLHTVLGTDEDERYLHSVFDDERVAGEWFKASRNLIDFINYAALEHPSVCVEDLVVERWEFEIDEMMVAGFLYDQREWSDAVQAGS